MLLKTALLACTALVFAQPVQGKTFKVIHSFCARTGCSDGASPLSPLIADRDGNLYGTTYGGGANGSGTVFRLAPDGAGGWVHSVIYSFCSESACSDGEFPAFGRLVIDAQGNLYGTTSGSQNGGTAYRLSPGPEGQPWRNTVLHNFCRAGGGSCADGDTPWHGLSYEGAARGAVYDGRSTLYGTTLYGGANGSGTVYSLTPGGKEKVLHHFCSASGCSDGSSPDGELIVTAQGKLIGATIGGGNDNWGGVVFALKHGPQGWLETVLHTFCPTAACSDGKNPADGGLMLDASGMLIGNALQGGANGRGAAYRLRPKGAKLDLLYSFCHQQSCSDGEFPVGIPAMQAGAIVGTLSGGGNHTGGYSSGSGMVYSLRDGTLDILHKFCARTGCTDGAHPEAGLAADGSGTFYGTTAGGGAHGDHGTVFAVTP